MNVFSLIRLLVILLINIKFIRSDLIIQESGVNPISENDMALIFCKKENKDYFMCSIFLSFFVVITLQNISDNDYQIIVSMQECCLDIKDEEKDCSSMYLIGGNMDILKPKTSTNVTLLYPNLVFRFKYVVPIILKTF